MSYLPQNVTALESQEVTDAYKAISVFFSCYALPGARKWLWKTIKAAAQARGWKGMNPADVLYFYDMMKKLAKELLS